MALSKLVFAFDVGLYLKGMTPKWSLLNFSLDREKHQSIYGELLSKFSTLQWKEELMPRHSVLDLFDIEIEWDLRLIISKNFLLVKLIDEQVVDLSHKLGIAFERI